MPPANSCCRLLLVSSVQGCFWVCKVQVGYAQSLGPTTLRIVIVGALVGSFVFDTAGLPGLWFELSEWAKHHHGGR
jgi:hypothetical protein